MSDLLTDVPPMPRKQGAEPIEATSADRAIAENLRRMQDEAEAKKRTSIAPPVAQEPAPQGRDPWWKGRTFYACSCGYRDERLRHHLDHPPTLPCWADKCDGTMVQYTPPGVERERLRHG